MAKDVIAINDNDDTSIVQSTRKIKIFNKLFIDSNYLNANQNINNYIIFFTIVPLLWILVYSLHSEYALPGGVFYPIWFLWALGLISGYLTTKMKLPGMLGRFST